MKTTAYARDVQAYLFSGVRPDWDAAAELVLSWHQEDPGAGGNQSTHEASFPGYRRAAVPRPGGFNLSDHVAALSANIMFAMRSAGGDPQSLGYVGIGTALEGAGKLLHVLKLPRTLSVEIDGAPFLEAGALKVTEH
jgi:hypothetical protein